MLGTNAVLEIQGTLQLGTNAAFTFLPTIPTVTNPGGFVKFSSTAITSDNIIAGTGSSIILNGINAQDKVLEITQESIHVGALSGSSLSLFKVTNGLITMSNEGRINCGSSLIFYNVKLTSTTGVRNTHRGLTVYGQPNVNIQQSVFENGRYGLYAWLTYGGAPLTLDNCSFVNCKYGLFTHDKGVTLNNCIFYKNTSVPTDADPGGYGWYAEAMSFPCIMNSCTAGGGSANGNAYGVFYKASTVPLQVNNSNISYNYFGLTAVGATVNVKCGSITENKVGIYLLNNGSLRMDNTIAPTGSQVNASNNYTTINTERGGLFYLNGGFNDLTPKILSNSSISGTIAGCSTLPSPPASPYMVKNNKWNNNCNFVSSNYNLTKVFSATLNNPCSPNAVSLLDNDPMNVLAGCGQSSQKCFCPNCPPTIVANPCSTCRTIETANVQNEILSKAVEKAMAKMNSSDSKKYQAAACSFYQILKAGLPDPNEEERNLLDLSYQKMIHCIGAAVKEKEIPAGINSDINAVLEIQNNRTDGYTAVEDYYPKFYSTLDKAQTYRLANRRDVALQLLNNSLSWAEDIEKEELKEWICMIDIEQQVLSRKKQKEEAIKATEECRKNTEHFRFTNAVNNVEVAAANDLIEMKIIPNPVYSSASIEYNVPLDGEVSIELVDMMGRTVRTIRKVSNSKAGIYKHDFNVSGLQGGLYSCILKYNGGLQSSHLMINK